MSESAKEQSVIENIANAEWKKMHEQVKPTERDKSFPASGACYTGSREAVATYLLEATPDTDEKKGISVLVKQIICVPGHWDHEKAVAKEHLEVMYFGIGKDEALKKAFKERVKQKFGDNSIRREETFESKYGAKREKLIGA